MNNELMDKFCKTDEQDHPTEKGSDRNDRQWDYKISRINNKSI